MDRIIDWVKVCDTKTSIMLSALSVLMTLAFTNEVTISHISELVLRMFDKDYYLYDGINCIGTLALFVLLLTCLFAVYSGCSFIKVLRAKKDERQYGNEHFTHSLIHFHHIASLKYDEFIQSIDEYSEKDYRNDLLSQIHINAIRCDEKFNDYNEGILWFTLSVIFGLITVLLFTLYFLFY